MANPNPSPETRFTPGKSGNPGGMSKETRAKIDAARDKAADVYLQLVTALSVKLTDSQAEEALEAIKGDNLKLLKDVMDRSMGTPKQQIEQDTTLREVPKSLDAFYGALAAPPDVEDDD